MNFATSSRPQRTFWLTSMWPLPISEGCGCQQLPRHCSLPGTLKMQLVSPQPGTSRRPVKAHCPPALNCAAPRFPGGARSRTPVGTEQSASNGCHGPCPSELCGLGPAAPSSDRQSNRSQRGSQDCAKMNKVTSAA